MQMVKSYLQNFISLFITSVMSDPTKKAIQSPIFKGDQNKFLAESG